MPGGPAHHPRRCDTPLLARARPSAVGALSRHARARRKASRATRRGRSARCTAEAQRCWGVPPSAWGSLSSAPPHRGKMSTGWDEEVVYDLLRAFSALASTQGPLFRSFSHGHHIPQHGTAGRTLQHANVALLAADFLLKAFVQIGRSNQRDIRPWKYGPSGSTKSAQSHGKRLPPPAALVPPRCRENSAPASASRSLHPWHISGSHRPRWSADVPFWPDDAAAPRSPQARPPPPHTASDPECF
jgi:hypothetical protein